MLVFWRVTNTFPTFPRFTPQVMPDIAIRRGIESLTPPQRPQQGLKNNHHGILWVCVYLKKLVIYIYTCLYVCVMYIYICRYS